MKVVICEQFWNIGKYTSPIYLEKIETSINGIKPKYLDNKYETLINHICFDMVLIFIDTSPIYKQRKMLCFPMKMRGKNWGVMCVLHI